MPRYLITRIRELTKDRGNTMTIEKNHAGAWVISDIIGGYRVARSYYGYTKAQAVALFRADSKAV